MNRGSTVIAAVSVIAAALSIGCSHTHSGGVNSSPSAQAPGQENTSGHLRVFGEPEWVGLPPGLLSPGTTRIVTVRLKDPVAYDTIYEVKYQTVNAVTGQAVAKSVGFVTDITKEPAEPNLSPDEVVATAHIHGFSFLIRIPDSVTSDLEATIGIKRKLFPNDQPAKVKVYIDNGNGTFPDP